MIPDPPTTPWRVAPPLIAALLLVGCQSYAPAPLDIDAYRTSLDERLTDTQDVSLFALQMQERDDSVPTQFDLSDGISPAEGEVLALFYNPDLRLARATAGVALATKDTAGLWEDPVFGFDGAEIVSPAAPFEFGLMGSLTIPISGRLEVEKSRAGAAYEAELRMLVDAEWRTRAELRRRWTAWTAAVAQADLIEDMLQELEHINSVADHLQTAGELNRVERRLLHIETADRTMQATEVDLHVIETRAALLQVLGLPPKAGHLLLSTFPATTPPQVDDVTARLIGANTELAMQFARYRTAEESLRLEIKKQFPDIVIGSGYGTEFNDHRVMFGLSIPVPVLNANRAGIAEATARREVARAAAETTFANLLRTLNAATTTLAMKQSQRYGYEQRIVPLLKEQEEDLHRIAELGELDMFVMLESLSRTVEAKRRLVELQVSELDATITVRRILGPDTRLEPARLGSVATGPSPTPNTESTGITADGGTP